MNPPDWRAPKAIEPNCLFLLKPSVWGKHPPSSQIIFLGALAGVFFIWKRGARDKEQGTSNKEQDTRRKGQEKGGTRSNGQGVDYIFLIIPKIILDISTDKKDSSLKVSSEIYLSLEAIVNIERTSPQEPLAI